MVLYFINKAGKGSRQVLHIIAGLVIVLFSAALFVSCNSEAEENYSVATESNVPFAPAENSNAGTDSLPHQLSHDYTYAPSHTAASLMLKQAANKYLAATETSLAENTTTLHYRVSEKTIDSLNAVAPIYQALRYDKMAINFFTTLSGSLHGKTFFASNPDSVVASIMKILTTRLNDGTDIVFVIDKTYSMWDDIDKVRTSLNTIMDYISTFNNVKLGVATYGDKNFHYNFWYDRVDLTTDIEAVRDYVNKITIMGNPDTPESVNDAIVKTVDEMNWTPGNQRMMMVIGDAPSLEPPLSDYTTGDVIKKCSALDVKFNLYPIVISMDAHAATPRESVSLNLITNVFPNPIVDNCTIQLSQAGDYLIEVFDERGRVVLNRTEHAAKTSGMDFSQVPNGKYFMRIFSEKYNTYASSIVIVQR